MAKKNGNKDKKTPKIAAQTVKKAEPKVAEQAAVAETKPEPKVETKTEPTKLTVVKDTRTKDEKRRDRLALRSKALEEALAQNLPFNENHPAMAFEQNYQQAFKDATTSPNAIPADAIKAAKAKLAEDLAKIKVPAAAEEGRIGERIMAKANDTPAIAEAIKHFNSQVAEGVEEVKPLVEGTIITEQKDELSTDAVAEAATDEQPVTTSSDEATPTVLESDATEGAAMEEPAEQALTNEFDEHGKLIRWPNESSKSYGRRKHEAKLSGAWKKPEITTVTVEEIDGGVQLVDETRNGEPPETKRYPTGELVYHSDHDGQSVPLTAENDNEIKVDDDLVKNGSFAATAETETSDATQDVPETQKDQPEEVQKPVQTEPVSKPVEPGPSEAKTDKTPTLVVDNKHTSIEIAAAKKFYGSAWTDERAVNLTEAHMWLAKAVDSDSQIRGLPYENKSPVNPRTRYRMAMNAALKFEALALGGTPYVFTAGDIEAIFADFPNTATKAA